MFVLFLVILSLQYVTSSPPVIINISSWIRNVDPSSPEWTFTAEQVDAALRSDGLFLAVGHDITPSAYNSAINAAYNLFSSDSGALSDVEVKEGGFMRGFIGFGQESGLQQFFEPKEGYSFGYNWKAHSRFTNKLQGYNVWPSGLDPSVVDSMNSMQTHSSIIAEAIVTNLAFYYEKVTQNSMGILVEGGDTISVMRLFHYFSEQSDMVRSNQANDRTAIGSSPHTDWGLLTVILQEADTVGLQVQYADAEGLFHWQDVAPLAGSVVVNGGDFLALASKGRYRSPVHRVICPSDDKDRMSFVYFYYPNYDTRLDVESVCTDDAKASDNSYEMLHNTLTRIKTTIAAKEDGHSGEKYLVFGDYIMQKWAEVFRGK